MIEMVEQSHVIISPDCLREFELAAWRIACASGASHGYSPDVETYQQFIRKIVKLGHTSVLEHGNMTVSFVTSIAVARELLRHRHCSPTERSTRYCKLDKTLTVIKPLNWDKFSERLKDCWFARRASDFICYKRTLDEGWSLDEARKALPIETATEVYLTANFREWLSIFELRTSSAADIDMQALVKPLQAECKELLPCVFDTEVKE